MPKNILIAFYSRSGNTERIASLIAQQTGGTLLKILPESSYPASYNAVLDRAKKEISQNFLPPLKPIELDVSGYDTILIGTPNWWSTMAPPLAAFLTENNLSGKSVGIFCTHGGGGIDNIERNVRQLCSGSTMLPTLSIYGNGGGTAEKNVSEWVQRVQ